ncbi:MAG: helix-turn-helix domain-containing protein [Oscillospiraceae bacterium]|mgnify:FL=1|jgi:DNA-binding helix-turn-helix protein|nr:helix-turn-helix transcriptional regulator [Ruminococcus sp.]
MSTNQIIDYFNAYLKNNGITKAHISRKTEIPADTISKILRKERRLMADEFLEICTAINISPEIFRISDETKSA